MQPDIFVTIPTAAVIVLLGLIGHALALYIVCKKLDTKKARKVPSIVHGVISVLFPGSLTKNRLGEYNLFGYPAPAGLVNSQIGLCRLFCNVVISYSF